jgi:hypothetical protein
MQPIAAVAVLILAGLFAPGLRYSLATPMAVPVDSAAFLNELGPLVNSLAKDLEVIDGKLIRC